METGRSAIPFVAKPKPASADHAMSRRRAAFLLCVLSSFPCLAQPSRDDDRTRVLEYQPGPRWPINTVAGASALILLERGDHVRSIEASDPKAIQVIATTSNDDIILSQTRSTAFNTISIKTDERSYDIWLMLDTNLPAVFAVNG